MKICSRRCNRRNRWQARHLHKPVQSTEVFSRWRLRWPQRFSTQISQATTRDLKWWPRLTALLVSLPSFSKWSTSLPPPLSRLTRSRLTRIRLGAASLTTSSVSHRTAVWIAVWHLVRSTRLTSSKIIRKLAFTSLKFLTQTQITSPHRFHSSSRAAELHMEVFKQTI